MKEKISAFSCFLLFSFLGQVNFLCKVHELYNIGPMHLAQEIINLFVNYLAVLNIMLRFAPEKLKENKWYLDEGERRFFRE
ncbi:hypothetical protein Barb6_01347 [Bacteroidales bacterium Barb6]|nr:hypothetical protein Barb4_01826 [Bacteroidales bacterium Barb4]OAV71770.1 hypothetical protein Barb6_01347 [Bacteroidales bacterium Barb6]